MNLYTYTDEDIMKVLQKAIDEIESDKNRAVELYDIMMVKMKADDGNLVVLSQMADRYLEQATRGTENLIKLAGVMQRLQQAKNNKKEKTDFKAILDELDLEGATPFFQKNAKGQMTVGARTEKAPERPPESRTTSSPDSEDRPKEPEVKGPEVSLKVTEEKTKKPEDKQEETPDSPDIELETDFGNE